MVNGSFSFTIHHYQFTIHYSPLEIVQTSNPFPSSPHSHLSRLPGAFFELIDGVEGFPAKLGAAEVPVGCRGAVVGLQQLEALDDGARAQIEHGADDLDELVVRPMASLGGVVRPSTARRPSVSLLSAFRQPCPAAVRLHSGAPARPAGPRTLKAL